MSDEDVPVTRARSTRDRGARHTKVQAALEKMKAARDKTESRVEQYEVYAALGAVHSCAILALRIQLHI
jgi:hypothetical protein